MRVLHALAIAALLTACASTTDDAAGDGTTPAAVTAAAVTAQEVGRIFLLQDTGGTAARTGPFLASVTRPEVLNIEDRLAALTSVTAEESAAGYTTAVPATTTVRSATVDGGVATVDLSGDFASGGGTFSMSARLAQVVYTATSGPEWAKSVVLQLDGQQVSTFSSEGLELTQPLTRVMNVDALPQLLVERPSAGEAVPDMLSISGLADASDDQFWAELLDADGAVVHEPIQITTSGTGWGSFWVTVTIPEFPSGTALTLRVWDDSPSDATPVAERLIPITAA